MKLMPFLWYSNPPFPFQAIIPTILMYLPVVNYLLLPAFGVNLLPFSKLVTFLYAAYPAVDPIPLFFIIDNYRMALAGKCKKCEFFDSSFQDWISVAVVPSSEEQLFQSTASSVHFRRIECRSVKMIFQEDRRLCERLTTYFSVSKSKFIFFPNKFMSSHWFVLYPFQFWKFPNLSNLEQLSGMCFQWKRFRFFLPLVPTENQLPIEEKMFRRSIGANNHYTCVD